MGTQRTVAKSFVHSLMIWRLMVTNLYLSVVRRYTCAAKLVLENKFVGYLVFIISFYTFCLSMTENGTFSKSSEEIWGNVLLSAVLCSFQYPFGEFFGSSYPTSIR